MGGFFNFDGPFYKFISLVADIFILTLLWLIFSIPILTAGTSLTAMYYVMTRRISGREGYIVKDFLKSFRSNLVQSVVCTVFFGLCAWIIYFNITHMEQMGSMKNFLFTMQIFIAAELIITSIYIFPVMSRFELKLIELFKTAFFMANRHIFTTITCLFLAVFFVLACVFIYPFFVVVAAGIYVAVTSYMFMNIFKKYRPEIDTDIDEN